MTELGNVVVALDLETGTEPVLRYAASLARAADSQLTVLHVISPTEQQDRAHQPGVSQFVDVMVEETERALRDLVHAVGLEGAPVRFLAPVGDPVDEILKAGSGPDDTVVIGMRRRSRVGKFLLGSDLQEILLAAHCPVVAVPIGPNIPSESVD